MNAEVARTITTYPQANLIRYVQYLAAVNESTKVKIHAMGYVPCDKLRTRQPGEPASVQRYREENYRAITQTPYNRIASVLTKINNANDFSIEYPDDDPLQDTESLADYCTQNYPQYDDIRNWLFTDGLHSLLTEPNGVVTVEPASYEWGEGEYPRPISKIYEAWRVLLYEDGCHCLVFVDSENQNIKQMIAQMSMSSGGVTMGGGINLDQIFVNGNTSLVNYLFNQVGNRYLYFDRNCITELCIGNNGQILERMLIQHNFNDMPVFKVGGDKLPYEQMYQSVISSCVPYWDEASLMNSDLQAAIKQHVFPERIIYSQIICGECKGKGHIIDENQSFHKCSTCQGQKYVPSPFTTMVVGPTPADNHPAPFPNIAYAQKDLAPIDLLAKLIEDNLNKAYSAINFEFLGLEPAVQSGIAKAYDRQEMNTFISKIATMLLKKTLSFSYWYIILYRYALKWTTYGFQPEIDLNALRPKINVPKSFDILPSDLLTAEITGARAAGMPSPIISGLEGEYVSKRFNANQDAVMAYNVTASHDPLQGLSLVEKTNLRNVKGCTEIDFILSCNIQKIVSEVSRINKDFFQWPYEKQHMALVTEANKINAQIKAETTASMVDPSLLG